MFNMDETWVATLSQYEKVLVSRSALMDCYPVAVHNAIKEHFTLVLCQSASGRIIRPMLIIPLEKVPDELLCFQDRIHLVANPSGWINFELFSRWVHEVFVPDIDMLRRNMNAPGAKAVLIVDNHNSRENPDALQELRTNNVDVVGLVPHSSYFMQPLDLFANNAIKAEFTKLYNNQPVETAGDRRAAILCCLAQVIPKVASQVGALQQAFRRACLWPFDPDTLLQHSAISADVHETNKRLADGHPDSRGIILTDEDFISKLRAYFASKNSKQATTSKNPHKKKH